MVVKDKIAQLPEKMIEWASEVLKEQCDVIVGLAKIYVAVDTGSLRDSIRVERGGEGLHWRGFRVRAGGYIVNPRTNRLVDYAVFVEESQPFLGPAVESVKPTIAEMINEKILMEANR